MKNSTYTHLTFDETTTSNFSVEQFSDTHIRLSHDGVIIYDSYDDRSTRYSVDVVSLSLTGPRERGLEIKENAESYY